MSWDYVFRHYLHIALSHGAYKLFGHALPTSKSCYDMDREYQMVGVTAAGGSAEWHNVAVHRAKSYGTVLSLFSTRAPQASTF